MPITTPLSTHTKTVGSETNPWQTWAVGFSFDMLAGINYTFWLCLNDGRKGTGDGSLSLIAEVTENIAGGKKNIFFTGKKQTNNFYVFILTQTGHLR